MEIRKAIWRVLSLFEATPGLREEALACRLSYGLVYQTDTLAYKDEQDLILRLTESLEGHPEIDHPAARALALEGQRIRAINGRLAIASASTVGYLVVRNLALQGGATASVYGEFGPAGYPLVHRTLSGAVAARDRLASQHPDTPDSSWVVRNLNAEREDSRQGLWERAE